MHKMKVFLLKQFHNTAEQALLEINDGPRLLGTDCLALRELCISAPHEPYPVRH
jgi:hypothetical protein